MFKILYALIITVGYVIVNTKILNGNKTFHVEKTSIQNKVASYIYSKNN